MNLGCRTWIPSKLRYGNQPSFKKSTSFQSLPPPMFQTTYIKDWFPVKIIYTTVQYIYIYQLSSNMFFSFCFRWYVFTPPNEIPQLNDLCSFIDHNLRSLTEKPMEKTVSGRLLSVGDTPSKNGKSNIYIYMYINIFKFIYTHHTI